MGSAELRIVSRNILLTFYSRVRSLASRARNHFNRTRPRPSGSGEYPVEQKARLTAKHLGASALFLSSSVYLPPSLFARRNSLAHPRVDAFL